MAKTHKKSAFGIHATKNLPENGQFYWEVCYSFWCGGIIDQILFQMLRKAIISGFFAHACQLEVRTFPSFLSDIHLF